MSCGNTGNDCLGLYIYDCTNIKVPRGTNCSPGRMPVVALCLIVCCIAVVEGQINLKQTGRDGISNTITLQCLDINDEPITDAVFYRNGAILTDDPCFSGSMVSGGLVTITVSPPCEG